MFLTCAGIETRRDSRAWGRRRKIAQRRARTAFTLSAEVLEDRRLLATVTVDLLAFSFSPSTVNINAGDTVHWVWSTNNHSSTSVQGSGESWDSGVHNNGFTFDHTFNTSGSFNYYCIIHGSDNGNGTASGMAGTVVVASAATLQSISVTPDAPSVPDGTTEQFTATGTFSDGSTQDITSQVTWASSSTSIATISNTAGSQGLATAVSQGTTTITASLDGFSDSTLMTVVDPVLQSIAVTPANPSVAKGLTQQFTATGNYSDNSTQDLSSQVIWASATASVATINGSGLATAVDTGSSTISAALGGVSGSTVLTVTAATLQSLAVTPTNPSVANGLTQQFTATGTYSDQSTQILTSQVTWTSSSTAVATINSSGLATAVDAGTSTIEATLGGVTGSTVITVTAAALQSITVTPANPSVSKGQTQQFTATGTYSDSSTQNLTSQVTWTSGTTAVATIGGNGLATAIEAGTSSISAALGGINGSTVMTVGAASLQSITVTPADPSVSKGSTRQFSATGTYSDDSTQDLTSQVTWASATASVATINGGGLATAVDTGTSTISAAMGSVTGSTVLTVTAAVLQSIAVTPANPSIAKGLTQQFMATGTYSDNSTQNLSSQVTWASATASVATINGSGLATAVDTGTSTISAALGGVSGSTVLTVTAATLQSIAVTPANPTVAKGLTRQFTATGTYSDHSTKDLTGQVTWASSDTAVATISNTSGSNGVASAIAVGSTTVSAMAGGVDGSTILTVTAASLQSITITPINPSIPIGEVQPFVATGLYSDNSTADLTSQTSWTSSNSAVASISNDALTSGVATGLGQGTSTIGASLDGVSISTTLTVTPAVLEMIMITPENSTAAPGQTVQFVATGMYSDNSTQDLTIQVDWTSSDTAIASISNDAGSKGLATAASVGTATITASMDGMTSTTRLTVKSQELTPVAVRDDRQGGFYRYGYWTSAEGGYKGSHAFADPITSRGASARWLLNVPAGTYDLWSTWVPGSADASNAAFGVYDGFNNLGMTSVDQRTAPEGGDYGGVAWVKLGTFTLSQGRLTVALSSAGADGEVVADAVLLTASTVATSSVGAMMMSASTSNVSVAVESLPASNPAVSNATVSQGTTATTTTPMAPATSSHQGREGIARKSVAVPKQLHRNSLVAEKREREAVIARLARDLLHSRRIMGRSHNRG